MTDQPYEQWLAERREVSPPPALADQIMSQVAELESQRRALWWLRVIQRIEQSRAARWGRVRRSASDWLLAVCLFTACCPVGVLLRS